MSSPEPVLRLWSNWGIQSHEIQPRALPSTSHPPDAAYVRARPQEFSALLWFCEVKFYLTLNHFCVFHSHFFSGFYKCQKS